MTTNSLLVQLKLACRRIISTGQDYPCACCRVRGAATYHQSSWLFKYFFL